jgi:hypothetical protein
MPTRLASASAVQARFVFQAQGSHVTVRATDRALGLADLMGILATDPKLQGCVIEQCAFDGELFTALLRKER